MPTTTTPRPIMNARLSARRMLIATAGQAINRLVDTFPMPKGNIGICKKRQRHPETWCREPMIGQLRHFAPVKPDLTPQQCESLLSGSYESWGAVCLGDTSDPFVAHTPKLGKPTIDFWESEAAGGDTVHLKYSISGPPASRRIAV